MRQRFLPLSILLFFTFSLTLSIPLDPSDPEEIPEYDRYPRQYRLHGKAMDQFRRMIRGVGGSYTWKTPQRKENMEFLNFLISLMNRNRRSDDSKLRNSDMYGTYGARIM